MRSAGRNRWGLGAAAVVLLALGCWQLGSGLYIKTKAALGQVMLEGAWQAVLAGRADAKPWPWADVRPVARLSVPRLGRSLLVLSDVSGEAMAWGPGHMTGTPLPGQPGLSTLGGHRDTHFSFLKELEPGDNLIVETADGSAHHFTVQTKHVVHNETHGLDFSGTRPRLALITCWPFDALTTGGPERFVVLAKSTEPNSL